MREVEVRMTPTKLLSKRKKFSPLCRRFSIICRASYVVAKMDCKSKVRFKTNFSKLLSESNPILRYSIAQGANIVKMPRHMATVPPIIIKTEIMKSRTMVSCRDLSSTLSATAPDTPADFFRDIAFAMA